MANPGSSSGASRGFGALVAEQALERGDNVVARARDPATVRQRLGDRPELLAVALDVLNEVPGDPAKLARALLTVVDAADPSLRMPFGSDAVRPIETKNAFVAQELARWRGLSVSTDAIVNGG